jgi:hypothetical protein
MIAVAYSHLSQKVPRRAKLGYRRRLCAAHTSLAVEYKDLTIGGVDAATQNEQFK